MKGVAVFQLAAFLGPIITDQNKAMASSSTDKGVSAVAVQMAELHSL
jgi:hypothetical protein